LVTELLQDLVTRGLDPSRRRLFVIDGSKALHKGISDVFGENAAIQRCRIHKLRNVLEKLPEKYHWRIIGPLRAAWNLNRYEDAKAALAEVVTKLDDLCSAAADSLREGLEETLTLHRLGVPPMLRQSLYSTNPIENVFSTFRGQTTRVRNWRPGTDMASRWAASLLLDAEQRFHRIKGHATIPVLINILSKADLKAKVG
jgi:transposase-like protein